MRAKWETEKSLIADIQKEKETIENYKFQAHELNGKVIMEKLLNSDMEKLRNLRLKLKKLNKDLANQQASSP